MNPDHRTKASFGKAGQELEFSGKKAVLLVSVGQRYHEGDKLSATVDLINRSDIGHVTVAVADTLQRTNFLDMPEDIAYAHSLRLGNEWLERNAEILGRLEPAVEILRWDAALADDDYAGLRKRVGDEYATNEEYRGAVDATIGVFLDRLSARDEHADLAQAFTNCLTYLLEECPAIMPLWAAQGHDFVIYPQPMTSAMASTREIFVQPEFPDKCQWLSLKFKKRAQALAAA
ncbi:tRNA-dependent cyclodipeptide synthase [Streptomyces sp. NPDC048518]|uniref:tRNA-dependent cyclodipeptide synthase n=1 Tax=Streptomyces sp. NPDC048518 TaxID=3155029 RepID=UPI0033D83E66